MFHGSPVHAVVRPHLQGIYIEEALSVHGDSRQDVVVKLQLYGVHIGSVLCDSRHAAPEESQADGRARLGVIPVVWQVVIGCESFQNAGGTDSSCQVHPLSGHIVPESLTGIHQGFVPVFQRQISHGTVHIDGSDCVSLRRLLIPHRHMGLGIGRVISGELRKDSPAASPLLLLQKIIRSHASDIDKILRKLQILPSSGHAVKPHQCELDLLVAGISVNLIRLRPEGIAEQISRFTDNL